MHFQLMIFSTYNGFIRMQSHCKWRKISTIRAWSIKTYSICTNKGTFLSFEYTCLPAKSPQLCPTLCDSMDCSLPDSSVHGILQTRILEWAAMPSSRGSSLSRDQTRISCNFCIAGRFFTAEPLGKPWVSICILKYRKDIATLKKKKKGWNKK